MKPLVLFFAAAWFAASSVCADITLVQQVESESTGKAGTQVTLRAKDAKIRIDMGSEMSTISDSTSGTTTTLVHQTKMAMQMPPGVMKQMSEAIKDDDAAKPEEPQYKPTGRRETISGFACEEYEVTTQGKKILSWFTKDIPDAATIAASLKNIQANMPGIQTGSDAFERMPGFPVRTVIEVPGMDKTIITLISVSADPLEKEIFNVPDGYQTVTIPATLPTR